MAVGRLVGYGVNMKENERRLELKRVDVSEDLFNDVLVKYKEFVEIIPKRSEHGEPCLEDYFKGYDNAKIIYYDGEEYLICLEYRLTPSADTDWKQVIVRKDLGLKPGTIVPAITGKTAWVRFNKMLSKYYTAAEIKDCLKSHKAKQNIELMQVHYDINTLDPMKVYRFSNVYKYDINGAHNEALCEIFPKAADEIRKMYEERKQKPINKSVVNYYCGMLMRSGYPGTYYWIIQRTTRKLLEAINYVTDNHSGNGRLIYANTDGFMIMNPDRKLKTSKELGDFKLEYKGDVYVVTTDNYLLYQTGEEMFGRTLLEVRNKIDLRAGKFVTYDRTLIGNTYKATNISEHQVDIVDYEKEFHMED